jgi:hypothetical protein
VPLPRDPLSFDRFFDVVSRGLVGALTADEYKHLTDRLDGFEHALRHTEAARREVHAARRAVGEALAAIRGVCERLGTARKKYDDRFGKSHWIKRVWFRVRGWVARAYRGKGRADPSGGPVRRVADLRPHVPPSDAAAFDEMSGRLATAAADLPELECHLRRRRFSPWERKRVETLHRAWVEAERDTADRLGRLAAGGTTADAAGGVAATELRSAAVSLGAALEDVAHRRQAEGGRQEALARAQLPDVLEDVRRPAEVMLRLAVQGHEALITCLRVCRRRFRPVERLLAGGGPGVRRGRLERVREALFALRAELGRIAPSA